MPPDPASTTLRWAPLAYGATVGIAPCVASSSSERQDRERVGLPNGWPRERPAPDRTRRSVLGPDWQPAPIEFFRHRVECETAMATGSWSATTARSATSSGSRADTLVWLDLPLPLVMWRLFRRTVQRIVTQEDLWGTGNRESLRRALLSRHSILLWALKTHRRNRHRFAEECSNFATEKHGRSPQELARR